LTAYYFGGSYEVTHSTGSGQAGSSTKKYYSFGGQTMMRDASELQYFLTDHLGSTVAITDSSGTLTSQQRYLPFGGTRTNVTTPNSPGTDFGYTSQRQLDAGMGGLMDYKARFYSPMLGRFIQPDTITSDGPQGLNRYSYVGNSPVGYNDPSGHMRIEEAVSKRGCSKIYYCENGKPRGKDNPYIGLPRPHPSTSPKKREVNWNKVGAGSNLNTPLFNPNIVTPAYTLYDDQMSRISGQFGITHNNGSHLTISENPAENIGSARTTIPIADMTGTSGTVTANTQSVASFGYTQTRQSEFLNNLAGKTGFDFTPWSLAVSARATVSIGNTDLTARMTYEFRSRIDDMTIGAAVVGIPAALAEVATLFGPVAGGLILDKALK